MLAAIAARITAFIAAQGVRLIFSFTVLLAVFLAGVKVESWRASGRYNALVAKHEKERADASEAARNAERSMFRKLELVEQNYASTVAQTRRQLAAANDDRDRMRNLIAQFNAYSVPGAASASGGADGGCADAGLLDAASRLARFSVRVVADADRLAASAATAERTCQDRLRSLQEYVRTVITR